MGGDKARAIIGRSERGAMTRTDRRGIPILDGVETAVAAARVAVSSATRSAFHRSASPKSPSHPFRSARLMPWRAGSDAMSRLFPAVSRRPSGLPGRRFLLSAGIVSEVQL